MFHRTLLSLAGGALAVALLAAQPVLAQDQPYSGAGASQPNNDRVTGAINERSERANQRNRRQSRPAPAPAAPTAEEIMAAAQVQVTAAGLACQPTEAINPGLIGEHQVYEIACANAAGYIIIASTPPQTSNCLELAGSAATVRARDPAADVGMQCVLPANQNGLAVIGAMARDAGVACTIDEAIIIGTAGTNPVYEVGCAGADGYRLIKLDSGWELTDCLQVASTGATCRFTTPQEQADTIKAKLAGTEAAGCDVAQARLMGHNPSGRFFEVKCAAEGEGYIVVVNSQGAADRTYTCLAARQQRIGNGCSLTQVPEAEAEAEAAPPAE